MEEIIEILDQIYTNYSNELEACGKKQKFTDGLFGFGHSIKDDPCHEKFYNRIKETLDRVAEYAPTSEETEKVIMFLFSRKNTYPYPPSAQLMLCAAEKHIIPLIPFLSRNSAIHIFDQYDAMYRKWERLPVQTEVWKNLKNSIK